jgi:hypothetical protein
MTVCALALFALVASNATAQAPPVDHWATKQECLAATSAPFYHPHVVSNAPVPNDEIILPHPTGGCFEIVLPDRITDGFPLRDRGWVRMEAGREFVFKKSDGHQPLRVARCDNVVFDQAPFDTGAVDPNPFAYRENTKVDAKVAVPPDKVNLLEQALKAAKQEEKERQAAFKQARERIAREDRENNSSSSNHSWYSWKSGTGKALYIGSAIAGAICIADQCWKPIEINNTNKIEIHR